MLFYFIFFLQFFFHFFFLFALWRKYVLFSGVSAGLFASLLLSLCIDATNLRFTVKKHVHLLMKSNNDRFLNRINCYRQQTTPSLHDAEAEAEAERRPRPVPCFDTPYDRSTLHTARALREFSRLCAAAVAAELAADYAPQNHRADEIRMASDGDGSNLSESWCISWKRKYEH